MVRSPIKEHAHLLSLPQINKLRACVLKWYEANGRSFPWRCSSNCFHVFIAEILLRQTQATRLVEPYLELVELYPDAQSLAKANIAELRKWFKPLGLFSRADYLVQAAQILVEKHNGEVPKDLNSLIGLPGMGIYSARAVMCLCFGMRVPMVDGGSGRVLQRSLGITSKGPAYSNRGLLLIDEAIIPKTRCKEFNLGLIDIAAVCCHPTNPECHKCPLATICTYWESSRRCNQKNMQ